MGKTVSEVKSVENREKTDLVEIGQNRQVWTNWQLDNIGDEAPLC